MRYGDAAWIAAVMLFAAVALAGGGHGWVAGAAGCFALAPIAFLAWASAFEPTPSRPAVVAAVTAGMVVCFAEAIGTVGERAGYLLRYVEANGVWGVIVAGLAYGGWSLVAVLALRRARWVQRHGT